MVQTNTATTILASARYDNDRTVPEPAPSLLCTDGYVRHYGAVKSALQVQLISSHIIPGRPPSPLRV